MLTKKQLEFLTSLNEANTQRLGYTLKFLRLANGYTQKEMADRLGTCRQHIQKWEYNIAKPTPKRLTQILELFDDYPMPHSELIRKYYL